MASYSGLFAYGEWQKTGGVTAKVVDPAKGVSIAEVDTCSRDDIQRAIDSAYDGKKRISALTALERSRLLMEVAARIKAEEQILAGLITREAGKPIKDSLYEVKRAYNNFIFGAEEAKRIEGTVFPSDAYETPPSSNEKFLFSRLEPVGVCLAISPFNYPLNLLVHKVVPALASGNSVIAKPASKTPLAAIEFAKIISSTGFPAGAFNLVIASSADMDLMLDSPKIDLVTFTGSTNAGLSIASKAAGKGKRLILEMGGMDPIIVLEDADIDRAVDAAVRGCYGYSSQVCIAIKRAFVRKEIAGIFTEKLLNRISRFKIGDPAKNDTDIGPLISGDAMKHYAEVLENSSDCGGKVIRPVKAEIEGELRNGYFVDPAVVTDPSADAMVLNEETFGPVLPVVAVPSDDELVEMANHTKYGLQASIFSRNIARALKIAYRLETGGVMINDPSNLRWDNLPFGGRKHSGIGREGIRYAMREMMETKLIEINLAV